jgi:transposase
LAGGLRGSASFYYEFHIPLDRQRKMIAQQSGVLLAESVMCDIIKAGCFWIEPVYLEMIDRIKKCRYLQADETPILNDGIESFLLQN